MKLVEQNEQRFLNYAKEQWDGDKTVALKALLDIMEHNRSLSLLENRIEQLENVMIEHQAIVNRVRIEMPKEEKKEEPEDEKPKVWGM